MLSAIRVQPKHPGETLDDMSRINFAKVYTVEHNVKAYDFGDVVSRDRHLLREQYREVWLREQERQEREEELISAIAERDLAPGDDEDLNSGEEGEEEISD